MNPLTRLVDRLRLRDAAPQVRDAYELYRDMTFGGIVLANVEQAHPRHKAVRKLLKEMRSTGTAEVARLDDLLSQVRTEHDEFVRIRELDARITPRDV